MKKRRCPGVAEAGTTATGYFVPVVRNRSGVWITLLPIAVANTPSPLLRMTCLMQSYLLGSFGNFDIPAQVAI
jgi:hypothetical protein